MESPVSTTNTSVYGIPIACSNCCDLLFPTTRADSEDCDTNHGFESHPVYALTQEEQVLAISSVLERIYRYEQLRDLNDYEEGRVENAPLCQKCANILNQMDILHQEFDQLRGLESYLSTKINKVDEIIRDRIVDLNLRLVAEDDNTRVPEDPPVVVKTEPEEPSKVLQPSGPWVVLKRLRPAEISKRLEVTSAELLNVNPLQLDEENFLDVGSLDNDNVSKFLPDVDSEPVYKQENVSLRLNTREDDTASCSYNKKSRFSQRNVNRSKSQSNQLAEIVDTTAEKANVANKRTNIKTSSRRISKGNKKATKKAPPTKSKVRRVKHYRLINFYRRKQVHPYPCYYCQEDFELESDRVEHLRGVHCSADRSIICPSCGKLFGTEQGKKLHEPKCGVAPSHYILPPYICNDCGTEFESRYHLVTHQKKLHIAEAPYACDQCDYKTIHASAVYIHKRNVHTVAEPVECPECHRILKNQSLFDNHYKNMHTPQGNSSYKEKLKRSNARRVQKHKRNRITTSVCLECNIDFQTVARYVTHRNEVHTTSKKWQCEQCGKGFNTARVFKNHQQYVHTDERPFICDQCGMSFKSPKNLRSHLVRVHTEEGRLKYNEYDKLNYQRKQRLAQELLKAKNVERTDN